MGQKVHPFSVRIGLTTNWKSRWFSYRDYVSQVRQDVEIRDSIRRRWKSASIASVEIERSAGVVRIILFSSRPGVLIGRGGSGIEDLTTFIKRKFFAGRRVELKMDVQEVKYFEENADLVAQNVAEQLERRIPFRRALKSTLEQVQKSRIIKGVKVEVSGRLGGAEMSRREWLSRGRIPLHTLRADIDFARATAETTYGSIGVKVWLYKGDVFNR
ncbi:MAG: 30S ribosomal protein S3 [Candidatus Moranbacteria bacterium]|nr:30S ribosomal protein S3 [Candidatus Moranbacteria bacterium]